MQTLTIIDTFGFFFRSFHALPPLKSSKGFPTGLLTGFVNFIHQLATQEEGAVVFALDSEGPSFRSRIDPNYKANRPTPPEDLLKQLPVAIEWIEKMGFRQLSQEGFEADDIIASLVRCAREKGVRVKIVSHDKDLYQLIEDGKVTLYDPIKKIEIDEARAMEKFGVHPKQVRDYLALVGDSSDNIPGVRGIGPKTAAKLLQQYGSLDGIYEHLDEVAPARVQNLLKEGKESAYKSRKLATLRDDLELECDPKEYAVGEIHPLLRIADELIDYDITAVLKKIKSAPVTRPQKSAPKRLGFRVRTVTDAEELNAIIDAIPEGAEVAFDTETDSLDTKVANLVGFSFAYKEDEAYYVPVGHKYLGAPKQMERADALAAIERLFAGRTIIGHNLKFDLSLLYRLGVPRKKEIVDTMILAWLTDPGANVGLDGLFRHYFGVDLISYKETVKKGEDFSAVPVEEAARYAAEDALATFLLRQKLVERLRTQGAEHLLEVAKDVEFPLIEVLIDMERAGIKIDQAFFSELARRMERRLEELTAKIYELAGGEFNINSTRQLASILFEKLGLPPLKKTKTGFSTDEATLAKLKGEHPIIEHILEYREVHKLKSTYVDPLLRYAKKDPKSRIYTQFVQTGTATGRLASKNPNLQNIPIRTELGRTIRKGFVAEEGYMLVGIDYSQIELRLLAHFSEDPVLLEAFAADRDIHTETAIRLFGPEEGPKKRHIAKTINFGLIYGMGSKKLAETLGISTKEAKAIIESYFASFPTVRDYLASIEEFAKEHGYVETLLGRRRYFDFERAGGGRKAAYLREAVNTVFQGSAADLIKMAMDRIHPQLGDDARMLLQIHDELIFEVREDQAQELADRYRSIMENIYDLRVPIRCSGAIAKSWGDLK